MRGLQGGWLTFTLLPLIGLLLVPDGLVAGSSGQVAKVDTRVVMAGSDYDRGSGQAGSEEHFEVMAKAGYRLAPQAPSAVKATAGKAGSGSLSVSWQEGWEGRGVFVGFRVIELPGQRTQTLKASERSATFSKQASGLYSFSVVAIGQYGESAASSNTARLLPAPPIVSKSHVASGCGYLIEINLSSQSLVASHCGSVYVSSRITSGRVGLRTPTGTYAIFQKVHNVYFHSPWPKSSPYYYSPMLVAYGMEFAAGGYYLHTDPNEPAGAFGSGSQNGPYASHGCVHVPYSVMASLYQWAPYGARVYIHY